MEPHLQDQLNRIEAKLDQLLSPSITTPRPRTPAQRANDELILALASLEAGRPVLTVTKQEGSRYGAAAAEIRAITQTVTPEEIIRRARNYQSHFPDCPLTANALAKHWRRCDSGYHSVVAGRQTQFRQI